MQAIIICAGRGTRMGDLTAQIPKPLLPVCGKPVLDWIVEALPAAITELVLVVGYRQEQIRQHCGELFYGRTVVYCEQADYTAGTGDALQAARSAVRGKFLFMYADDIHGAPALAAAIAKPHAMLCAISDTPERFGVVVQNADGTLHEIIEKPINPPSSQVNIGGFVVEPTIFEYVVSVDASGEVLVTDMLTAYAKDYPVSVVTQAVWLPIGYPEHIEAAERVLCPSEKS